MSSLSATSGGAPGEGEETIVETPPPTTDIVDSLKGPSTMQKNAHSAVMKRPMPKKKRRKKTAVPFSLMMAQEQDNQGPRVIPESEMVDNVFSDDLGLFEDGSVSTAKRSESIASDAMSMVALFAAKKKEREAREAVEAAHKASGMSFNEADEDAEKAVQVKANGEESGGGCCIVM